MTIQEKIKGEMKDAMKTKEVLRLSVLRGIISAFTNETITLGNKPDTPLGDEDAMRVIIRAAKQRKDSIEQFEKGGRQELADSEKEELIIIEQYLPEMMGEDEVRAYILEKKDEMSIDSPENFGQLMGAVMAGLKGKADGDMVKKIIDELLQE